MKHDFKLWQLFLLIALLSNFSPANAGYYFLYDGVVYNPITDNTAVAEIGLGYYGSFEGDLKIHPIVNSYTVVGISPGTFKDSYGLTGISIPETVTYIGESAFRNCSGLKSANIPSKITAIENYTFGFCSNLSSPITIPAGVTNIGNNAFAGCSNIPSVTFLGDKVTSIGDNAFAGCHKIPSAKFGNNVTYIGNHAFQNCKSISEISIPTGVTTIGVGTFSNCTNLKSINLHNNIDTIKTSAFGSCSSLETIILPRNIKEISNGAFSNCTSLKNINLPEGLRYIDVSLFSGCESLETIILPESISHIDESAFFQCKNLKSIIIPNNVNSIYKGAFSQCSSLENVYFGKNISLIGFVAFSYCTALKELHFANPIPPSVVIDNSKSPFDCVNINNITLYVPNGSANAYKNHSFWKQFNIIENPPVVNSDIRSAYAYDLSMEGNNGLYTLMFNVTGNANANIILTDTETGENTTIEAGEVTTGNNIVELDANNFSSDKQFNWSVEIISPTIEEPSVIFDAATAGHTITTNTRGGVTFITDTESDAFGKTVVSNGYNQGIDIYSATQQLERTISFPGDANNAASSYRCAEHNGIVYIADWSDACSGIYTFDPASPSTPKQWFDGTRNSEGVFTNTNGNIIGGSVSGLDFKKGGNNSKMLVFGKDYPSSNSQQLVRYDFGDAKTWANAPNAIYPKASALLINTNVDIVATQNGFFASQVRYTGNNSESVPAFIYVDDNDNILYNSGATTIVNGCCGAIAVNNDSSLFAIATPDEGIVIFALSWNENGVPAFTKLYTLPSSISSGTNSELTQLDFDIAGNLHAFLRNDGYRVYALPKESPKAVTAAKKHLIIKGTTSGVENISINENNSPIKYYNLQGTEITNPSNGIFIKVQGNSAHKILIK